MVLWVLVSNRVGLWYNLQHSSNPWRVCTSYAVSNRVGLWYNLQHIAKKYGVVISKVSNRVGLWYNLQPNALYNNISIMSRFQTELVCGIICNPQVIENILAYRTFQTELVCGIICNLSNLNLVNVRLLMFQTELVCGIICNIVYICVWSRFICFKPSWFVV